MLRRLWTILAHSQGALPNQAQLAGSLAVSVQNVAYYIALLCDLTLVRRLPAWHGNLGKRLVRSPKVYVRDSGIVHALPGLGMLRRCLHTQFQALAGNVSSSSNNEHSVAWLQGYRLMARHSASLAEKDSWALAGELDGNTSVSKPASAYSGA
jgi:hypothetical protein